MDKKKLISKKTRGRPKNTTNKNKWDKNCELS